jgi:hypothetical protein
MQKNHVQLLAGRLGRLEAGAAGRRTEFPNVVYTALE